MSDEIDDESGAEVPAEVVKLSAMHMALVLANTIGEILKHSSADRRQGVFLVMGAAAKRTADEVRGDAPDELKRDARLLTNVYVDNALIAVAKEYGLSVPGIKNEGPKMH